MHCRTIIYKLVFFSENLMFFKLLESTTNNTQTTHKLHTDSRVTDYFTTLLHYRDVGSHEAHAFFFVSIQGGDDTCHQEALWQLRGIWSQPQDVRCPCGLCCDMPSCFCPEASAQEHTEEVWSLWYAGSQSPDVSHVGGEAGGCREDLHHDPALCASSELHPPHGEDYP